MSKGRYTTLGTPNYVYFVEDTIGRGVSGNVHRGRHKKSGEIVAVKTLSNANYVTDKREFDIMRQLEHKNVIKLHGIEKETVSKRDIIIMEYAKAGSLSDVLDKPENAFGLPESEFINFLKQLACGIDYLWSRNIVHRDLKPGNVLIAVDKDGSYIYKLADFGAARMLRDKDEKFMSMHGTQEYLPPNVYERAVLRKPVFRLYDRSVDLWALGATIYQAATSHLPFQNLDGRDNKDAMFRILKGKKRNHISGKELPNGGVEYSEHMPVTCMLARWVKSLLEDILRDLFIDTDTQVPDYEKFFRSVKRLENRVIVHVFLLKECFQDRLYVNKQHKYKQLVQEVTAALGLPPETDISKIKILKGNSKLENMIDPERMTLAEFPLTDPHNPLVIYEQPIKETREIFPIIEPIIKEPPPRDEMNLSKDLHDVKKLIGTVDFLKDRIEDAHTVQQLMAHILEYFYNQLFILEQRVRIKQDQTAKELESCSSHIRLVREMMQHFPNVPPHDPEFTTAVSNLEQRLRVQDSILKALRPPQTRVEGRQIKSIQDKGCGHKTMCYDRIRSCNADTNKVVTEFYKHRDLTSLDSNMKQIHHYNRKQIHKDVRKLSEYMKNSCHRGLSKMHSETMSVLVRLERIKNEQKHNEKNCDKVKNEVARIEQEFKALMNRQRSGGTDSGHHTDEGPQPPNIRVPMAQASAAHQDSAYHTHSGHPTSTLKQPVNVPKTNEESDKFTAGVAQYEFGNQMNENLKYLTDLSTALAAKVPAHNEGLSKITALIAATR